MRFSHEEVKKPSPEEQFEILRALQRRVEEMNRRKAVLAGHDPDIDEPYPEGQDHDSRDRRDAANKFYQSSPFSDQDGIDFVVPLKNEDNKTDHSIESLSNIQIIGFDAKDDPTPLQ